MLKPFNEAHLHYYTSNYFWAINWRNETCEIWTERWICAVAHILVSVCVNVVRITHERDEPSTTHSTVNKSVSRIKPQITNQIIYSFISQPARHHVTLLREIINIAFSLVSNSVLTKKLDIFTCLIRDRINQSTSVNVCRVCDRHRVNITQSWGAGICWKMNTLKRYNNKCVATAQNTVADLQKAVALSSHERSV